MRSELLRQKIKGRVIHWLPFLSSSLQSSGLLISKIWRTACFRFLHRGAWLICIGAKDTAVSLFVSMRDGTCLTSVEQLARGCRHHHLLLMLTVRMRAGQGCQERKIVHISTLSESCSSASSLGRRPLGHSPAQREATWRSACRIQWSSPIFCST